jgi:hypothetical protein
MEQTSQLHDDRTTEITSNVASMVAELRLRATSFAGDLFSVWSRPNERCVPEYQQPHVKAGYRCHWRCAESTQLLSRSLKLCLAAGSGHDRVLETLTCLVDCWRCRWWRLRPVKTFHVWLPMQTPPNAQILPHRSEDNGLLQVGYPLRFCAVGNASCLRSSRGEHACNRRAF